jgi:hypothetical protein
MNRTLILAILSLSAILLVAGAACNSDSNGQPYDEAEDRARLQEMEAEIDTLIGDAKCKKDEDCLAIAFGAKPCGGPWTYKVYSVTSVDTLELARLVADYNKFNEVLNQRYGWMSDCTVVSRPRVGMIDERCDVIREGIE